jgi:hypothetical protein
MDPLVADNPSFKVCLTRLKIGIETGDEGIRLFKLGPPLPPRIYRKGQQNACDNCCPFYGNTFPRDIVERLLFPKAVIQTGLTSRI